MTFINHVGISARQFDISIGASNGYILRMQKNRASIGSDVIENILRTYPQLNVIWLLTGEGKMLKETDKLTFKHFDDLPADKQQEIEAIIDQKIRERQDAERRQLLREVTAEIERTQKKLK